MKTKKLLLTVLFLSANLLVAQGSGRNARDTTPRVCQLVSANPPGFNPYQFVPKVVDFRGLNRRPRVSFVVNEDGSVDHVKVLQGSGSRKVDAGLIKSIQAWRYQPSGCRAEMNMMVTIEIG